MRNLTTPTLQITVTALPSVPVGWQISVDNDPSWKAVVKGSCIVGAAAVGSGVFKDFVVITKDESLGLRFEANADVFVAEDFQHQRRIHVGMKDLILKKAAVKPSGHGAGGNEEVVF